VHVVAAVPAVVVVVVACEVLWVDCVVVFSSWKKGREYTTD
jgi:hypothetical protein